MCLLLTNGNSSMDSSVQPTRHDDHMMFVFFVCFLTLIYFIMFAYTLQHYCRYFTLK